MSKQKTDTMTISITGAFENVDEAVERLNWFMNKWKNTEKNNHKNNLEFVITGKSV